jgi:hypothetical protein
VYSWARLSCYSGHQHRGSVLGAQPHRYFRNGGAEEIYLGSADLMRRNLSHRVEILFPVRNPKLVDRLKAILHLQLADERRSHHLRSDGHCSKRGQSDVIDSQLQFLARENTPAKLPKDGRTVPQAPGYGSTPSHQAQDLILKFSRHCLSSPAQPKKYQGPGTEAFTRSDIRETNERWLRPNSAIDGWGAGSCGVSSMLPTTWLGISLRFTRRACCSLCFSESHSS